MPYLEIKFNNIVFDPKVQTYCLNPNFKCPDYNHYWSCPPVAPYLEKEVSQFQKFFLIYYQFDLESYVRETQSKHLKWSEDRILNRVLSKGITRKGLDMEINNFLEIFQESFQENLILIGGHCHICSDRGDRSCTFDTREPCRYPDEMKYSMEAVGIEVDKTVKSLNFEMEWPPKRWIYRFGLVCFK